MVSATESIYVLGYNLMQSVWPWHRYSIVYTLSMFSEL